MPVIRVTLPQNAWTKDEKADIAAKLTDALAEVGSISGKGDIKQYITLHILEASEGGYAMGGTVIG